VVVVTYNSQSDIGELLASLPAAACGLSLRTIVIDNGSTDKTIEIVSQRSDVVCIRADKNRGYAAGINIGREQAGEYSTILVLNPDVLLDPGSVTEMYAVLRHPQVGVVVPMLLDADGYPSQSLRREPTLLRALGDCLFGRRWRGRPGWLTETVWNHDAYKHEHTIDWATGAVMMISSACDKMVGSWDEGFFLYSEEVDYAARVRDLGFEIKYLPTARARHRGGGSGTSNDLLALWAVNKIRYAEARNHWPKAYRGVTILHQLLRSHRSEHRAVLRILLRRSRWFEVARRLQRLEVNDR